MMATKIALEDWFDRGVSQNKRWMVVICDTFDYGDFPCYYSDDERIQCVDRIKKARNGENMSKLMEVYDLKIGKERQLIAELTFNEPS